MYSQSFFFLKPDGGYLPIPTIYVETDFVPRVGDDVWFSKARQNGIDFDTRGQVKGVEINYSSGVIDNISIVVVADANTIYDAENKA